MQPDLGRKSHTPKISAIIKSLDYIEAACKMPAAINLYRYPEVQIVKALSKYANYIITGLFAIFMGLAAVYAWTSIQMRSLGPVGFIAGMLAVVAIIVCLRRQRFAKLVAKLNFSNKQVIVFLAVAFVLQVLIYWQLLANPQWDPGDIMKDAIKPKEYTYFSHNTNTIFLFLFEHILYKLAPVGFHHTLLILNLVCIDLAVYLMYRIGRRLPVHHLGEVLGIGAFLFWGTSPWALIFYSDTTELPLMAGSMLIVLRLRENKQLGAGVFYALLYGFLSLIAYLLKPTALIFSVALLLILLLDALRQKPKKAAIRRTVLYTFLALVLFGGCLKGYNHYIYNDLTWPGNNGTRVHVIKEIQLSPWHFIMMGLKKNGSYNVQDFQASAQVPTYDQRVAFNKRMIKKRLQNYGFWGYLRFLVSRKYLHNTADGTFGWDVENHLQAKAKDKHGLTRFWAEMIYNKGKGRPLANVVNSITWTVLLFFGFYSTFLPKTRGTWLLRIAQLTIVGVMIYLLIFEGGRTRYLFMWLPLYLVCGGYGLLGWRRQAKPGPGEILRD